MSKKQNTLIFNGFDAPAGFAAGFVGWFFLYYFLFTLLTTFLIFEFNSAFMGSHLDPLTLLTLIGFISCNNVVAYFIFLRVESSLSKPNNEYSHSLYIALFQWFATGAGVACLVSTFIVPVLFFSFNSSVL